MALQRYLFVGDEVHDHAGRVKIVDVNPRVIVWRSEVENHAVACDISVDHGVAVFANQARVGLLIGRLRQANRRHSGQRPALRAWQDLKEIDDRYGSADLGTKRLRDGSAQSGFRDVAPQGERAAFRVERDLQPRARNLGEQVRYAVPQCSGVRTPEVLLGDERLDRRERYRIDAVLAGTAPGETCGDGKRVGNARWRADRGRWPHGSIEAGRSTCRDEWAGRRWCADGSAMRCRGCRQFRRLRDSAKAQQSLRGGWLAWIVRSRFRPIASSQTERVQSARRSLVSLPVSEQE